MKSVKRMINIFMAPSEVFQDLREKSNFLIPIILVLVVSLLSTIIVLNITIPVQVEEIHNMTELSSLERDQMLTYSEGAFPYIAGIIGVILVGIAMYFIMAGLISLIRFVFGGDKIPFKNIFSAVAYVGLISIPASLFYTLITYSTGEVSAGLTLGLFLPNLGGYLESLLGGISLFGIWETILYAILLMVFFKYSKQKAFSIMFGLFIVWRLLSSLLYFVPGI